MKVVDMFGAGLPVCAVDYNCITELVKPDSTGLLFKSPQQLAEQLLTLLKGFTGTEQKDKGGTLAALRAGVARDQSQWRWQDNWQAVAAPVFAHYAGVEGGNTAAAPPARKAKKVA
jgi:beta-1,4-mannosyltransferase